MPDYSTPAIMIRRIDFGDYDLITTFLTLNNGKITLIAKSAKKSTKRFGGILELFSVLQVVYNTGNGKNLPILKEAVLKHPFSMIRTNIKKTAYASYWAELIDKWTQKNEKQIQLFNLFYHVLERLDKSNEPVEVISILFQIKFLSLSGICPNIACCLKCNTAIENISHNLISFDLAKGSILCNKCNLKSSRQKLISKGTIKQLLWLKKNSLAIAQRIKFTPNTLTESLNLLENFAAYHMDNTPKSLSFLNQIRKN